MSSIGDIISDILLESGETENSKDHGFAFYEFLGKLLKIVAIAFVVVILFIVLILVLEHYDSPILDWTSKIF